MKSESEDRQYEDILNMTYPFPLLRPRMSTGDRAAQFAPFSALTGYEETVQEAGRLTEADFQLQEDVREQLDRILRRLAQSKEPEITLTYFQPDAKKDGGAYETVTGKIKRIDPYEQELVFTDGASVPLSRIYRILYPRQEE